MPGTLARNPFPQYQVLAFGFELKSHSSRTVFADAHPRPPTIPALCDTRFQSPFTFASSLSQEGLWLFT